MWHWKFWYIHNKFICGSFFYVVYKELRSPQAQKKYCNNLKYCNTMKKKLFAFHNFFFFNLTLIFGLWVQSNNRKKLKTDVKLSIHRVNNNNSMPQQIIADYTVDYSKSDCPASSIVSVATVGQEHKPITI